MEADDAEQEWEVEEIIGRGTTESGQPGYIVKWRGFTETTTEPVEAVNELAALDRFLERERLQSSQPIESDGESDARGQPSDTRKRPTCEDDVAYPVAEDAIPDAQRPTRQKRRRLRRLCQTLWRGLVLGRGADVMDR